MLSVINCWKLVCKGLSDHLIQAFNVFVCGKTKWSPNANPIISSLITLEKIMWPLGATLNIIHLLITLERTKRPPNSNPSNFFY